MRNPSFIISSLLVVLGLLYSIFLHPKLKEKRERIEFNDRVLGFIDGLDISGVAFGCTVFEMRSYVESQLAKAHNLPENQHLFEYTAKSGRRYVSHLGRNNHALFAILCIVQYAQEHRNDQLLAWCESVINDAAHNGAYTF